MNYNLAISTLVGLLAREAIRQRQEQGVMVERQGGLQLTPSQMDKLADWLNTGQARLSLPVEAGPEKPRSTERCPHGYVLEELQRGESVCERCEEASVVHYSPPAKDPYLEGIMARRNPIRRRT